MMRLAYMLTAVALPALVLGIGVFLRAAVSGRPVPWAEVSPAGLVIIALLIGAPFLAMALGTRARQLCILPLTGGVVFTLLAWGAAISEIVRQGPGRFEGADNVGFIILVSSPLTLGIMAAIDRRMTSRVAG